MILSKRALIFTRSASKTTISGVSDVTVQVGETKVISATASSGAEVSFVSANTAIAIVDENGTVTGVAEGETTITVSVLAYNGYPAAVETCKVTVTAAEQPAAPITVTKLIKDISGTTANGTQVLNMKLDDVITATASKGSNNGKVYSSGEQWRLYQSDKGTITISATSGYLIQSVKFTYTSDKNGVLMKGTSKINSGTIDTVNTSTVTYSVGNTGSATNGQVRITAIEVVYKAN